VSAPDALAAAQAEAQAAADELLERYEEINLLYGIGESLGRTVALDEAASAILLDIARTLGARRGAILVHDPAQAALVAVARRGLPGSAGSTVPTEAEGSWLARAFRERALQLVPADAPRHPLETALHGELLAVPILWSGPNGDAVLGVLALADRAGEEPFSAGDQKLLAAIATQIGAAIENARLVRDSLAQQRLAEELRLAHDLQMRLLPAARVVAPDAEAAARVVPAQHVGGDFYHWFALPGGRTGVMIGDVSGHGYQAALIMALTLSAAAIHAQRTVHPAKVLRALLASLADELSSTDMFFTVCYAVIDPRRGTLRYANLGHPHAFRVHPDGRAERLAAQAPPLGLGDGARITVSTLPWAAGRDRLLAFTDGVSDARDATGRPFGEAAVLAAVAAGVAADDASAAVVDRVFAALGAHQGPGGAGDDCSVVVVRA
jgi:phosphoserine phosphatase RsbU/P